MVEFQGPKSYIEGGKKATSLILVTFLLSSTLKDETFDLALDHGSEVGIVSCT